MWSFCPRVYALKLPALAHKPLGQPSIPRAKLAHVVKARTGFPSPICRGWGEGRTRAGAQRLCAEGKPEAGATDALWLCLLGNHHRILSRNGANLSIQ